MWIRLLTIAGVGVLVAWARWEPPEARLPEMSAPSAGNSPHLGGNQPPLYPTTVRRPTGPPRVQVATDSDGQPITVACGTCHSTRTPNRDARTGTARTHFHQRLVTAHGDLSCLACHDESNYDQLHLADGRPVAYVEVDRLCQQCHGPQTRDWRNGSHGGMQGYWDLTRGPRTRHGCTDCHDPHSPAFPRMIPTFKPRDRFLEPRASHDD